MIRILRFLFVALMVWSLYTGLLKDIKVDRLMQQREEKMLHSNSVLINGSDQQSRRATSALDAPKEQEESQNRVEAEANERASPTLLRRPSQDASPDPTSKTEETRLDSKTDSLGLFTDSMKQLYQYRPRQTRTMAQVEASKVDCSAAPAFHKFFGKDSNVRSRAQEDYDIYRMFFKKEVKTGKMPQRKRTYVEMGGFDGVHESNSRFFDVCLGWYVVSVGLLVLLSFVIHIFALIPGKVFLSNRIQ